MMFVIVLSVLIYVSMAFAQKDPCNEKYHDQASCDADDTLGGGCTWCKCSALPSACFTIENSHRLPPSIYACDKPFFREEVIIEVFGG